MPDLNFKIDSKDFEHVFDKFRKDLQRELNESVQHLASMTFEKTLELAGAKLHSTFHIYKDALSSRKEGNSIYIVSLDQKALWIEEGIPSDFDMKPGLLKKGKTAKDGKKYRIVPFSHNTRPSQQTQKAKDLTSQIKKILRAENIPFAKIEKNADGSPKMGLLHKIDIKSAPPTAKASHGALEGLRIYQTKSETGNVSRGIFTFRTVKEGVDKFIHPGLDAQKFMDQSFDWAMKTWDSEILPELMKKWGK